MQELLGLGDAKKLKSVAGLAGGIGHQGEACGIVVGGALALALASAGNDEDHATVTARGCTLVNEFVQRFAERSGSTRCRDIAQTDFDDDRQLRRYVLGKSRTCVKLAGASASMLADIVDREQIHPGKHFVELTQRFSESNFHCAQSVVMLASEELGVAPVLPSTMLIPLNGGIGYSGSTCAALLGGCIVIGLQKGGDTSQTGMFTSVRRLLLTLIQGASAFHRLDLSPANDALLRCAELAKWFQTQFHSRLCREITEVDFQDEQQSWRYFEEGIISRCISMAQETAAKAAALAR
ncbi:MAG: C_GCAxxG_C_C family protein [Candidatus Abyssobacteria bacterium SURF_17]|uniref:C_GCAxxG_C_C family protein n=1 Tax=Candidatus Abyssobacteria bacterium SURF_17 TaxID=2093361 RepID=A0A419F7Y2_9BACT|nr:MAG: C_GCAxxG_C_C family protein [Candidatus Abyssubacteria bacterium SURF_17]